MYTVSLITKLLPLSAETYCLMLLFTVGFLRQVEIGTTPTALWYRTVPLQRVFTIWFAGNAKSAARTPYIAGK